MVNEFCGFRHGVIGTDKMPADTTLNNMKKADLIKLLHTAQHNYETLMWFYNNAVKANMSQLKNNGWIPCNEMLPEKNGFYLVTQKRYSLDTHRLMGIETDYVKFEYGKWGRARHFEIIAWQPLPIPYKEGSE